MGIYEQLKTAYGNHFQDLFAELMKQKYGINYQPISTNGNIGDMCVDGVLNYNTAFAVYAPETYNDSKTMEKMKSDFYGFLDRRQQGCWSTIQKYIFVIKRERTGVTPTVFQLITEFQKDFPVEIMTLDDLYLIENRYLPFSDDGRLLLEFKNDVTEIMEYIIKTDFAAEPFIISLGDEIQYIFDKWNKKKYTFHKEETEDLKKRILKAFCELCQYLTDEYVHLFHGQWLMFNNNSVEAGIRLRNELRPGTIRVRKEVRDLLDELYNIK